MLSIHIHPELVTVLMSDDSGVGTLASLLRQSLCVVQKHGSRIAYAPAVADGVGVAVSVRRSGAAVVVDIDRPGTVLPGRDVVLERETDSRYVKRTVHRVLGRS